ncbi:uncharacterized protein LOC132757933 [Ruditapes philippinarum]|uniref:uncharacterized protein LOC132757933 n=1 Tax=Ruditapes philippinarum TaxID=129788 RepID=UPI00295AD4C1|nr:uncharacterized protein LOC132757933 [Ruditapes philippinarum]
MSEALENLQKGDEIPAFDDDDEYEKELWLQHPEDLDIDKFNRGRNFFKKNISKCLIAMMMSLICGLSINRFLKVLVCTGMTSSPFSSFKRYMGTTMHVLKWHYGNVWDPLSSASKSIRSVRKLHSDARTLMQENDHSSDEVNNCTFARKEDKSDHHIYISQYEMGLVQSGFMGSIIMYPDKFGIRCSNGDLDDYVYFWRWIGYLLGIDNKYNICIDGYEKANMICHAIEQNILIPSLYNPPVHFYPMADAFVSGFKFYPLASTKSIIATGFRLVNYKCPFPINYADTLRIYFARSILVLLYYFPSFTRCLNRGIEKMYKCDRIT